jgi:cytochrome c oxidase assembly protein subunit 11
VTSAAAQRNNRTALIAALVALGFLALAFASVPLYRAFCQLTGFDGTPLRAEKAPGAIAGEIGVRFDANVDPKLPWKFEPLQNQVRVHPGGKTTIYYQATNLSARPITGQAVYNVTPDTVGQYFNKIQCFCFNEQTLKPGETVKMPVVFYVDPKLRTDDTTKAIDEITLSYTFYPVETAATAR